MIARTYEMTQNVVKLPEPARSSSTGKSGCDGGDNSVVVVGSVENDSKDTADSGAKSPLSRKAKKSISEGV